MRAYVAGPMSGLPDNNFPAFRDATKRLRAEGWEITSPVELDELDGFASTAELGDEEYKNALSRDLRKIMDVEAIILLPGWEKSAGAKTELALANHYGLKVFYYSGYGQVTDQRRIGDLLFDETTEMITSRSGGRKGIKICRYDLIPHEALAELSAAYGIGAKKYDENNWLKGIAWMKNVGALMRHLYRWVAREDFDPETGIHHMALVSWHAFALMTFQSRGLGEDDRP